MIVFRESAVSTSCVLAWFDPGTKRFLGAHTTGWSFYQWDLPGGSVDAGEPDMKALVREIREETGARLSGEQIAAVRDLGTYYWGSVSAHPKTIAGYASDPSKSKWVNGNPEPPKNLHVFYLEAPFNLSSMHCDSLIDWGANKGKPEVDKYGAFTLQQLRTFAHAETDLEGRPASNVGRTRGEIYYGALRAAGII
jgi:8-oxo-dGTP pyrophosphatase MutT (NUDIX family)